MKKITLLSAALLSMFTAAQAGNYKSIVANDPKGDVPSNGIDVKNLSYEISSDKKNITFAIETYSVMTSWSYSGFIIYTDDNMDPSTGMVPECDNKSMKADKCATIVNMMGSWMSSSKNAAGQTSKIDGVSVMLIDNYNATLTMPLTAIDGDGDGQFNMIFGTAVAGTGSSSFAVDDLPNTGYSKMDVFGVATSVGNVAANAVAVSAYPNPSANEVTFTSEKDLKGSVTLYDVTGRQVADQVFTGSRANVSVQNLAEGVYVYHIADADKAVVATGRIAVRR